MHQLKNRRLELALLEDFCRGTARSISLFGCKCFPSVQLHRVWINYKPTTAKLFSL